MIERQHLKDILHHVTIFAGVTDIGFEKLCNECGVIECSTGDVFIREGTPAKEIYIILEGKIKIVLDIENDPLELIELHSGDCIGETSVIGIQRHSASAVVTEPATLLVLSRDVLMDIYNRDKEFFSLLILNIARELARRLLKTDTMLLHYKKLVQEHNARMLV